jgi:hypothetical protein
LRLRLLLKKLDPDLALALAPATTLLHVYLTFLKQPQDNIRYEVLFLQILCDIQSSEKKVKYYVFQAFYEINIPVSHAPKRLPMHKKYEHT